MGGHHGEPVSRLHNPLVSGVGAGAGDLIYPQPVTVSCTATFSLAGNVSAVAEELGVGPEPSSVARPSAAAEPDAADC